MPDHSNLGGGASGVCAERGGPQPGLETLAGGREVASGTDCQGCGMQAGLQEGQIARGEPRPLQTVPIQAPLVCAPFKPRSSLCQVSISISVTILPVGPSSTLPMLIGNLQPPGQSPFSHTLHCPIMALLPVQGLASWMAEEGKGERTLESN